MIIATIGKLVLAVAIGYYLYRTGVFTVETNQKLTHFILTFTLPLLVMTSLNGTDLGNRGQILFYIIVGLAFYGVMPFVGKLMNRLMGIDKEESPVYEAFYIFPNNLFMGYPVCASLYGTGCIFFVSVFNLAYNILFFTYGNWLFKEADGQKKTAGDIVRSVMNPGVVSSLAAVVLFLAEVKLPDGFVEVCQFVGNLTSPLSMVVIGSVIASYSVTSLLKYSWKIYLVCFFRLMVIPAVTYVIMTALGFSGAMLGVAVISMGMPVGAMVSMGCVRAQKNEELGAAGIVVSTILSLLTTPVLLLLMG
ncbi:MAG: AEC family transporter [Firmicutes bacterium]|nr:AEC family transporter [Bacillota bacterium]